VSLRALDHVLVLTGDLPATRAFYVDALGLRDGERPPLPFAGHWLYLGETACVHVADRGEYAAHARTVGLSAAEGAGTVDHVAFSAAGYDAIRERLARAGVEARENVIEGTGIRQLFATDPNGVRIEINVG
jgi:catechol 2,3-dioxygenase-like lactoylglutathione lyase family enzyme